MHEARRTVRADTTYEGIYWYGEHTYFEFLPPGEASGKPAGSSGLAFGVETEGATTALRQRLGTAGIGTFVSPISRDLDGEQVPWFDIMGIEAAHEDSRLSLFSLQYDRRFLASWHPERPPAAGAITRRAVLARYAAQLRQKPRLLQDIEEVYLELDERERAHLEKACRQFGYEVNEGSDALVLMGPSVSLVVRDSDGPGRITGFRMSLRRPAKRRVVELGAAELTIQRNVATLRFRR